MRNPRMGRSKRAGVAGVAVAAFGLLLGMTFVGSAGAQDGGDSYTSSSPVDRDADGNGIPDDLEDKLLNSDLGSCSVASYTVNEPFTLKVFAPVDATQNFVVNQYSQSLRLFSGTAPRLQVRWQWPTCRNPPTGGRTRALHVARRRRVRHATSSRPAEAPSTTRTHRRQVAAPPPTRAGLQDW